jgi:hypothetical protein
MPRGEKSPAWDILQRLRLYQVIPDELYVLDRKDGGQPQWTIRMIEYLRTGGLVLTVCDVDLTAEHPHPHDVFYYSDVELVTLRIITHPNKTLRTQPYLYGTEPPGMLCDLDQQGRHVAKAGS